MTLPEICGAWLVPITPICAVTAMNKPVNSSSPLPNSSAALTAGRTTSPGATPEGPGVREVLTPRASAAKASDSSTSPIATTATPVWSRSSLARPPVAPPIAARAAMNAGIRARASCARRLRTTVGSSEGGGSVDGNPADGELQRTAVAAKDPTRAPRTG